MSKFHEKKILIYHDEGVSSFCIASLLASLNREKAHHIVLANRDLFQSGQWKKETHLVIFPGGRDVPYHEALKGAGNQQIRDFVENGGYFLGICAGGYYGSAVIEFERNRPLEVIANRELRFFPGIARGPAYGLGRFDYHSEQGAQIAKINLSSSQSAAYYNGGCAFIDAEKYSEVSVLGRYADIEENPAAIIKCKVGRGKAILSGVHPEHSAFHDCTLANIRGPLFSALKEIEKQRQELFSSIMDEYHLS